MKHKLKIEDFILDEIESIELIGDEDTIDIEVEDTHMFFANDIYTHNSSTSLDVVKTENMGGSLKKAQIAHFIMSIAKTLPQKEANLATIAILKNRLGKDGMIFENCIFNNGTLEIDLGETISVTAHDKNKERKQIANRKELYQEFLRNKNNSENTENIINEL